MQRVMGLEARADDAQVAPLRLLGNLRLRIPYGTKISLAADAESPGVGPPEIT